MKAAKGTIVSFAVLTAAPLEAEDLPDAASEFDAALRAESDATDDADGALDVEAATVPAGKLLLLVPLALPPEVLTQICFSVVGLCQ